jgi:MFS family permease
MWLFYLFGDIGSTLTSSQLPIWFQAIKDESATQSGIDSLPSMIGLVVFAILGGGLASAIGYYTPLLIVSSVITAIGAGLLSTLQVNSGMKYWFGYQVLQSAGVGVGAQNALMVASVAVVPDDMAMATSILTFTQTLSSSIFLPVAQSVFQNQLLTNLRERLPATNAALIVQSGATGFRKHLTSDQLPLALYAYNKAISRTFYVAVATASLSIFGPLFMEWLSLKSKDKADDKKKEESQDAEEGACKTKEPNDQEDPGCTVHASPSSREENPVDR